MENLATSPAAKTREDALAAKAPSTTTPPSVTSPAASSAARVRGSTSPTSHPSRAVASTAVTAPVRWSSKYARTPRAPLGSTHASQPASASPRSAAGCPGSESASAPKPGVLTTARSANDARLRDDASSSVPAFPSVPASLTRSGTTRSTLAGSNPSRARASGAPSAASVAPYTTRHSHPSASARLFSFGMPRTVCRKSSRRSTGTSRSAGSASASSPRTARRVSSRELKQSARTSNWDSPPSAKRANERERVCLETKERSFALSSAFSSALSSALSLCLPSLSTIASRSASWYATRSRPSASFARPAWPLAEPPALEAYAEHAGKPPGYTPPAGAASDTLSKRSVSCAASASAAASATSSPPTTSTFASTTRRIAAATRLVSANSAYSASRDGALASFSPAG